MSAEPNRMPWPELRHGLVAILRGIAPAEVEAVAIALFEEGFGAVEVPLNSPEPFVSIERLARIAPAGTLVGAGTVLDVESVDRLAEAGGRMMVSPNVDATVIGRANLHGMLALPGVFTPTEALAAWRAGASALKFFPASVLGPSGIAAIRAVLPPAAPIVAVGGVSEADFAMYSAAGIRRFGLGSSLYRPGMGSEAVRVRARTAIAAYDTVFGAPG